MSDFLLTWRSLLPQLFFHQEEPLTWFSAKGWTAPTAWKSALSPAEKLCLVSTQTLVKSEMPISPFLNLHSETCQSSTAQVRDPSPCLQKPAEPDPFQVWEDIVFPLVYVFVF